MRIRYLAPFGIRTGYARAAMDYANALLRVGAEIDIIPLNESNTDSADVLGPDTSYHGLMEHVQKDLDDVNVHLVHTIPGLAHHFVEDDLQPEPGVKRVCYTTWETDTLPRSFAENLKRAFDLIIVPCQWNLMVFAKAGIPSEKLAVVPHTYDDSFWVRDVERARRRRQGHTSFYTIGVWGSRKNLVGTIVAYWHAFANQDADVSLKILCPKPPEGEVESLIERAALPGAIPETEFITRGLSDVELRQFHLDNDVFVSATRGEAWGLGAFEAAILGNPIIMSRGGGQEEFIDGATHSKVPVAWAPVLPELHTARSVDVAGIRMRTVAKAAPTGIDITHRWLEPDLNEMSNLMRQAHEGYPFQYSRPLSMNLIQQTFRYESVGRKLLRTLKGE